MEGPGRRIAKVKRRPAYYQRRRSPNKARKVSRRVLPYLKRDRPELGASRAKFGHWGGGSVVGSGLGPLEGVSRGSGTEGAEFSGKRFTKNSSGVPVRPGGRGICEAPRWDPQPGGLRRRSGPAPPALRTVPTS